MKLSKDDLFYIFDCADDPDQHVQGELDMNDIKNALIEDDLEIEGYERVQWTRFNPNDPNTFPPKKDGRMFMVHQIYNGESIFNIATSNTYWWGKCNVTHWRPLPPPVESNCE